MRTLVLWSCLWVLSAAEAPVPAVAPAREAAAEADKPKPGVVVQPALISVAAKQGGTISFSEKDPSKLFGGVRLGYEEAFVQCDHVHYWQSKLAGLKRPTLDHALFASGPESEEPERVTFDTRASRLPQIAFRGRMQPREVEVIRQPLAAGDPGHVRFRVLLHQLGEFAGDLQTADGWAPHSGWAEEAELLVLCDLVEGGIANPRFATVTLHGRPGAAGVERRPARLARKHVVADPAAPAKEPGIDAYDWNGESSRLHLAFDEEGRLATFEGGADYRAEGVPSLDMTVPRTVPAPAPVPAPR